MEYQEIKKLIEDVGNSKLTAIDIEFPDGIKIKMEKPGQIEQIKSQESQVIIKKEETAQIEKENYIKSPMVGTFYSKPSPNAKEFVTVGSKFKKGDTVCIIEAMKLMNEIEAEQDGEIVEILVQDGDMVDFGKKLFKWK